MIKSILSKIYYKINFFSEKISIWYERYFSIFLSKFVYFPYMLLERYFIKKNFYFLINISEGIGHVFLELASFDFKYNNNKFNLKKDCKLILVYKESEIVNTVMNTYFASLPHIKYIKSNLIFYALLPLFIRNNKELIIDIGCGEQTYSLVNTNKIKRGTNKSIIFTGIRFRKREEFKELAKQNIENHDSKNIYDCFFNKLQITKKDLDEFKNIGIKDKITVLIHINERSVNACARPLSPITYLKLIEYIHSKDYQLVFIGREKYPEVFKKYNIINYPGSNIVGTYNDLKLFKFAEYSIINASGLASIPRYLNKYYMYINAWHIDNRLESEKCIMLPTLISSKQNNQYNLYNLRVQANLQNTYFQPENIKDKEIDAPEDIDLLNCFKELEELKKGNFIPNNKQIILKSELNCTKSYISKSFIERKKIVIN